METEIRIAFDDWRKNLTPQSPASLMFGAGTMHIESIYQTFSGGYSAALVTKPSFQNDKTLRQEFEAWYFGDCNNQKFTSQDAWAGFKGAAKPRDERILALERELAAPPGSKSEMIAALLRERDELKAACAVKHAALKAMHDHASESSKVYFEEDILSKPIGEATDLGEAYQDSDMCQKTSDALAYQAAAPWLQQNETLKLNNQAMRLAIENILGAARQQQPLGYHLTYAQNIIQEIGGATMLRDLQIKCASLQTKFDEALSKAKGAA